MTTFVETLAANQRREFRVEADYLRILSGVNLRLSFYRNGALVQESVGVGAGFDIRFIKPFDRFDVQDLTGIGGAFNCMIGSGVVMSLNAVSGAVSVTGAVEVTNDAGNALPVSTAEELGNFSHQSAVLIAANTVENVLAPAANVNGVMLYKASAVSEHNAPQSGHGLVLMTKLNAYPTGIADGIVLSSVGRGITTNEYVTSVGSAILLPAGYSLAWVNASANAVQKASRFVRGKVL